MHTFQRLGCLNLAALAAAVVLPALAHEAELHVGASGAGQLKVEADLHQPLELPASIFPGVSGYATAELAFHSIILDEPANDFFQLTNAANLRFVLLAKDAGMEVWNDTGSGYMNVGESFFIGPAPFDSHPIWNLVNGVPGTEYSLMLKLIDLNGVYSESAPFTLAFTPMASPATGPFEIRITRTGPLSAMLSWPTNAVLWELESTVSLAAANWNTSTNIPDIAGTNFTLSIASTNAQEFFRLRRQ